MIPLIGRQRELALCASLLDEAVEGRGSVVALSGEAGIGKSRLARELLAIARARGFLALSGTACPYQGGLSYAPMLEALRPLVATDNPGRARLVEGLADLGRLFVGLPLPPPTSVGDPSLERTRLFEAVSRMLQRVADREPVVLLIDDVHWADPSSLDLFVYLARSLAEHPCLIVVTLRSSDVGDALRSALATLRRAGCLMDVQLSRLDDAEVAALAARLLGDPPPAPLLDLLEARAQGIPLFVDAVVASLTDTGQLIRSAGAWVLGPDAGRRIRPDVAELMLERLERLVPEDRAVVEAVSVCGDGATPELLAAVCPDEPDLLQRLARLLAAGLLIEELAASRRGTIVYRTGHPLLAEAAYSQLPEFARRRKHALAVAGLERAPLTDLSRLAHHIGMAGSEVEPHHALQVLMAAAEHAVSRRAGDEGIRHAKAALELADEAGRDDLVPKLLDRLAQSATHAGRSDIAITAGRAALSAAGAEPDVTACRLRRLALAEWDAGSFGEALHHLDQAADVSDLSVDERLRVIQIRLILQNRAERYDRVAADLAEVEAIAARIGHPRAVALTYLARLDLAAASGAETDPDDGFPAAAEAAHALGDPGLAARLRRPSQMAALARGEHGEAIRRAEESLRLIRAENLPVLEVWPRFVAGYAAFQAGDWDGAATTAGAALVVAHRVGTHRGMAAALALRALVAVHRGDYTGAETGITEARAAFGEGDRSVSGILDTVDALLALGRGDAVRAVALAVPAGGPLVLTRQVAGEAQLAIGDRDAALRTATEIAAAASHYCRAVADRLRGRAAAAVGSMQGPPLLASAVAIFDRLGMPFDAAVGRLDWAEAVAGEDEAAAAVERSVAVLDGLGARPTADRARRLLRRLGRRPAPTTPPDGRAQWPGGRGRPAGRGGTEQQRRGGAAVHQPAHGHHPPREDLSASRDRLQGRADPVRAGSAGDYVTADPPVSTTTDTGHHTPRGILAAGLLVLRERGVREWLTSSSWGQECVAWRRRPCLPRTGTTWSSWSGTGPSCLPPARRRGRNGHVTAWRSSAGHTGCIRGDGGIGRPAPGGQERAGRSGWADLRPAEPGATADRRDGGGAGGRAVPHPHRPPPGGRAGCREHGGEGRPRPSRRDRG